jgi:hypothetical protein
MDTTWFASFAPFGGRVFWVSSCSVAAKASTSNDLSRDRCGDSAR